MTNESTNKLAPKGRGQRGGDQERSPGGGHSAVYRVILHPRRGWQASCPRLLRIFIIHAVALCTYNRPGP